ncbi:MAG: M23 family metallopeptidase [Peptococcaceae bacterium MAG4]|nr:M23 family metallopeptidase [Peptococcaceae bacterium MAG4]
MDRKTKKRLACLALRKLFAVLAPVSVPLAILVFAVFAAAVFVAAVYSSMPVSGTYTGVKPSEKDKVIYETALKLVDEYNVKDTWLTRSDDTRENLGFLADRYGHDREIANQWGDIYASVLQKAFQHGDENRLENMNWVKSELKKLASDLHPKFYYKESTVTVCGEDGECTTTIVFLLTEADTIRGHYTYHYEWVTESVGGDTVTYEKYVGQQLVGPKWERLEKYLKSYLDVPDEDLSLARQMVFEAGQGFTARKEWLEWLAGAFGGSAWASGAMVPPELMDFFKEAERAYGIPWWFLAAVAFTESSFDPQAENPSSGCFGIMQVSPVNWKVYASKLGYDVEKDRGNPKAQIMVGAYLLKKYLGDSVNWNGDWKEATLYGLTFYSGHRSKGDVIDKIAMERCRQDYASKIWSLAESFKSAPASWPVPGYTQVSSYYGYRTHPITGKWQLHNGIDIAAPEGAPVVSVSAGIAYVSYDPGGYGNLVVIKDGMYEYYYAHLSAVSVASGQTVRPGSQVGLVGSTGASTGPHLHFGIKPLDCGQWIDPLGFFFWG